MPEIPRRNALDETFAFKREGYAFMGRRYREHDSDVFRTRLLLRPVVIAYGEDAARMFYKPSRFTRRGAMPLTTLKLLQDKGSVQTLDDTAHERRKALFLAILDPVSIDRFTGTVTEEWRRMAADWQRGQRIVLLDAAREVLCRAACRWAGFALGDAEIELRTREFAAMIEGAGSAGVRLVQGLGLRARNERWARDVIRGTRRGSLAVSAESPIARLIAWRDAEGNVMEDDIAGVELLNLLRPSVAVARFVVFGALALHEHPEWRQRLVNEKDRWLFVQEVRRLYPFFPLIGGRAREAFEWRGHRFRKGDWVLLDLHGTDHDPRIWEDPDSFRPERFRDWDGSAFNFVPQGGGNVHVGHRCPGERTAIALLDASLRFLATELDYTVPPQDFSIDLARLPTGPADGFVMTELRLKAEASGSLEGAAA